MNWRRLRYAAGFAAFLWLCVGAIVGIVKLIEYLFRGHPGLADWVCLGLVYTAMFGAFGWMVSSLTSRPTFRRKGWGASIRKTDDDDPDVTGWRRS